MILGNDVPISPIFGNPSTVVTARPHAAAAPLQSSICHASGLTALFRTRVPLPAHAHSSPIMSTAPAFLLSTSVAAGRACGQYPGLAALALADLFGAFAVSPTPGRVGTSGWRRAIEAGVEVS